MNVPILFLSLIAVASCYVPISPGPNHCEKAGPEVYCASAKLTSDCDAEAFCKEYLLKSPCEKGPEVYCKTTETALSCDKEAYCLTWPDDSVVAVKLVTTTTPSSAGQIYWNGIG